MNSTQLTTEQAKLLGERVSQMLGYLHALKRRMEKRGFPLDDKLRQKVERAYDAVHDLSVELHYMSCKGGVGRQGR